LFSFRFTISRLSKRNQQNNFLVKKLFSLDTDDSAFWTAEQEYAERLMAVFETVWDHAINTFELTIESTSENPSAVHISDSDAATSDTRQRAIK